METDNEIDNIPSRIDLMDPTLHALHALGGSASISELLRQVIQELDLSLEVVEAARLSGPRTDLAYQLAWARTYLKKLGLIDNSQRGVWSLTKKGHETTRVDPRVAGTIAWGGANAGQTDPQLPAEDPTDDSLDDWRTPLLNILKGLEPSSFERVCQRMLRESGFTEVEITGRPGDGGIDGKGILQIGGFISFPVLFQCKRYSGNVGTREVRDFRGAMAGRASKGMIVTTGGFTNDAYLEATRDGVEPIDLISGELLANKMKELGLGVTTTTVEKVEVDPAWFDPMRSQS